MDSTLSTFIILGLLIIACFYLGSKLTFQIRERKKNELRIDFDDAKHRERKH